ncbi:hypothetical protein [Streptomyces sp. M92]|uniref:hypothetical protein n=1 Tax=Streptomyces sp. M92 TaxID=2944250 RepID=UPI00234A5DA3|nr:hypothetical protein [Streptomyces sp. M92]WCN06056.1 hypothetical protein M6G08_30440 [Streptomyces sp. M92]
MPVRLAKVQIDETGRGTVDLDGLRIPAVRAVEVVTEVGCRPVVKLEIVAREVDLRQGPVSKDEEVSDAAADG